MKNLLSGLFFATVLSFNTNVLADYVLSRSITTFSDGLMYDTDFVNSPISLSINMKIVGNEILLSGVECLNGVCQNVSDRQIIEESFIGARSELSAVQIYSTQQHFRVIVEILGVSPIITSQIYPDGTALINVWNYVGTASDSGNSEVSSSESVVPFNQNYLNAIKEHSVPIGE